MKYRNKMRLKSNNQHLLDVFTTNFYYEIGTISEKTMRAILKKKPILLSEVIDFSVANIGLGSQNVADEQSNCYLPIVNFLNIFEENQSKQLFITEGIYYSLDDNKKESFAPIILIPILISREENNMYVRMVSNPIPNTILIDKLRSEGFIVNDEKLESIYSFDRYINSLIKENNGVRLENYITFASLEEATIIINHEKFSLENKYSDVLDNQYYLNEETEIFNITKLNYDQRSAVLKAKSGNSFAINGVTGVGKTTTLINIALDAVYNNKKVLYVSNMSSTLNQVESTIANLDLGFLIRNVLYPFDKTYHFSENTEDINDGEIKKELLKLYREMMDYEINASGRVQNHRFLDIITELLKDYRLTEDFKCDDLSGLYRFEYEDIIQNLSILEKSMASINFKQSLFVGIPINNSIKYPNQVLTLLFQLHRLFSDLNNYKIELQDNHEVKKIDNYARFKNYINDISGLSIASIPIEWKKTNNFHQAMKNLNELKDLIYSYQEHQLYIDWDYVDYDNIDIDSMIKVILGDYFTEEDNYKVDRIIISNKSLINRANAAIQNYRLLSKNTEYLRKALKWDIDLNNNNHIEEVLKLSNFINNSYYHHSWVDVNKQKTIYEDLQEISRSLNRYILLGNKYNKFFNNKKSVNQNIDFLKKIIKTGKHPRKFNDVDLEDLLESIVDYNEIKDLIPDLHERHINITGYPYDLSYDTTLEFRKFLEYVDSIEDENIKKKICVFLEKSNDFDSEVNNQELNNFTRSYNIIIDVYDYISSLVKSNKHEKLNSKISFIGKFLKYLNNVFKTNLDMIRYLKDSKRRVSLDVYLKLRNELKQVNRIKGELREKTYFSKYFGKLFQYEKTDVSEINNVISSYQKYIECFKDDKAIYNSFDENNYARIQEIISMSRHSVYEINESFKLYNKIFKDGIGSYYYDDFDSIIVYLYKLMNAKDELKLYLEVTSSLQVIDKYKLFVLSNYIRESNSTYLVDNFNYKYFKTLYDSYYSVDKFKHDLVTNSLTRIVELEDQLIKYHINQLQNKRYSLFANEDNRKHNKQIFLSNTTYVNYELKLDEFDLILIDDAHLSSANEYSTLMSAKQIIIAGNGYMKNSLSSSLLMRMRNKNIVEFPRRYDVTPLQLLRKATNIVGPFFNEISFNKGYEIVTSDVPSLITSLINTNNKAIINCFIPNLDDEIELTSKIVSNLFNEGYARHEVIDLFLNNINIVDIFSGHILNSDYNILDIESYYYDDRDFLEVKQIISLGLVRKKVFFIDKFDRLNSAGDNKLVSLVKSITSDEMIFRENSSVEFLKLQKELEKHDIVIHGRLFEYSFVIERNNKYYPVILFADPTSSNTNILEIYRENFVHPSKYTKVLFIWLLKILNDFDGVIDYILKETQ